MPRVEGPFERRKSAKKDCERGGDSSHVRISRDRDHPFRRILITRFAAS
jgi:hypothetical protein